MLTRGFVRAAGAVAAATALLAASTSALGTNYNHDGETTYCWQILQPPRLTKLNESDRVTGYAGAEDCPVVMTVKLSTYTAQPFEVVNVTWTATADFSKRNLVNMTRVVYGPDSAGNPAQIVHSNVHSCVFGTGCDPFSDGEQLVDKTVNRIANFSDNRVTWVDSLKFPKTGDFSILAHLILPDTNASKRFDYAVYAELVVKDAPPAPAPVVTLAPPSVADATRSGGGLSSAGTVGIIVGGVVLVALIAAAVVFQKRRHGPNSPGQSYMAPPAYEASMQLLAGSGKAPGDADGRGPSDCVTDTSTTAGFQSAWSGPAGGRPSQNLDGTGGSNVSGSSYVSIERESQLGGVGGLNHTRLTASSAAGTYRDGSLASSATQLRPRRVDSDVEL
ncbi:hypothetical protein PybrP1_005736 [[Pythium] brassicae (nom. inval.)]|nr:hypothetical protein PybrP1_005736 [[Pythium] brassicae (nom. inval.)]